MGIFILIYSINKITKTMQNLKTYEEFNLFGRPDSPEEEYQKQKRQAQKERTKMMKGRTFSDQNKEEEEEEPVKNYGRNTDPYGEEDWEES
jgi:hypothetical protein